MKRLRSIILAAGAVMVGVLLAVPAPQASAVSSAALSITPKKNYVIKPGNSVNDKLTIRNLDYERPLELNLRVVDFTFNDDGGTPKLMLAEDAPQTTWSLKPFLDVPESVTIAPGKTKTVDMSVAIPQNQGAGSFYSAIVYSSGAPDGGNVGLSASGVSLVFAQVPGKVKEDLQLEKLGAYNRTSNKYSFITADMPDAIGYTLANNGNVTESPSGSIVLKDMFGRETRIANVNPNESLALIGQSRTFTSCIKLETEQVDFNGANTRATTCANPGLWPGRYTIDLDLFYGQNGNLTKEITGKASFWYLPWWFVFTVLILLLIITLYTRKFYRQIRGRVERKRRTSFRRR